jgi:diguanylate cyclase (GGDEF)-like protein
VRAIDAASISLELRQLRERFLARARAETQTISELCEVAMRAPRGQRERAIESSALLLHRLAGTSGTLGAPALGDMARLLERICQTMLKHPEEGYSARLLELSEGAVEMRRIIDEDLPVTGTFIPAAQLRKAPEPGDGPLVCVVSRQAAQVRMLQSALTGLGYQVRDFPDLADYIGRGTHLPAAALVVQVGTGARALAELTRLRSALRQPTPTLVLGAQSAFGDYLASVRAAADGYFPMPLDLPRLEARLRALVERDSGEAMRVLVVDDDAEVLDACHAILHDAGMQVRTELDPSRVLAQMAEFRPEVVLTDIHMPQCTGPELAQVIRMHDEWTHVPIVYVSSANAGADQLLATRKAGEAFVSKPIDPRELVATVRANGRHARQVAEAVSRDGLTGVLKRSFIHEYLAAALERAQRSASVTSVAMIDIDNFKAVNDLHGHPVGDLVIRTLATTLRKRLRASDGLGRVGGEEFLAVLPGCESEAAKALLAEALARFREIRFASPAGDFTCTFSAGIAESHGDELGEQQLVILADQTLYGAKRAGRNRVSRARQRRTGAAIVPPPAEPQTSA